MPASWARLPKGVASFKEEQPLDSESTIFSPGIYGRFLGPCIRSAVLARALLLNGAMMRLFTSNGLASCVQDCAESQHCPISASLALDSNETSPISLAFEAQRTSVRDRSRSDCFLLAFVYPVHVCR